MQNIGMLINEHVKILKMVLHDAPLFKTKVSFA